MEAVLIFVICATSLVSFFLTVYDKKNAKRNRKRVRENTLLIFAVLGGAAVMYITMLLIRHKTKHLKFMLLLPLMIVFHLVLLFFILEFGETYYSSFLDFFR